MTEDAPPARRTRARKPLPRPIYGEGLSIEDLAALAIAGTLQGLDAEIAVMRVLVRMAVRSGDIRQVRQAVEGLSRVLLARKKLTADQENTLDDALNRVLDTLADELEADHTH